MNCGIGLKIPTPAGSGEMNSIIDGSLLTKKNVFSITRSLNTVRQTLKINQIPAKSPVNLPLKISASR